MLTVLKNGLRVLLVEQHSAPVVALQVWVNVGSADESDSIAGISHVLEHMVFKGTARRGVGDVGKEIEGAGGDINAWTSFDQTVYHIVMASRYFDKGLDVLADAVQNAKIDAVELSKELKVILEEIKGGDDSPSRVVSRDLFATAFLKHPYGRPVIGWEKTVKAMSPQRIRQFFKEMYTPDNMIVVVVGDFNKKQAIHKIEHAFSQTTCMAPKRKRLFDPPQRDIRVSIKQRDIQEAYLSLAFHIPGLLHADTPAIDLCGVILGHGETSRFVKKIRRDKAIVTDIYAYAYSPIDPGMLIVGATLPPKNMVAAVEAIAEEIFSFRSSVVESIELQRGQILIESESVYQKETVQGQARKLGYFQTVAGRADFDDDYRRWVANTTAADIRAVASRYFRPENLSIAIVTPKVSKGLSEQIKRAVIRADRANRRGKVERAKKKQGVVKVELPNGARLLVLRDPSVPLVSMRAAWNGGLRAENEHNNGINNLLAALITRGTSTCSGDEINAEIEGMAGGIGGVSGRNSFGIRTEMLSRHWERGLEILADCIYNPAFEKKEVEQVRKETLEDIRAQKDNLTSTTMQLFTHALYKRHPYRLDILGTEKTVTALSREDIEKYYRKVFRSTDMALAVVGDVDPNEVSLKFAQLFGKSKKVKAVKIDVPKEPDRKTPDQVVEYMDKQQAHMVLGFCGATLRSKDRFALEVIAALLSGQGGRLFLELRDKKGLAYNVSAFSIEGIEPGYIAAYVATSPNNLDAATEGIEKEFQRLKDKNVSKEELQRVKRYLAGTYEVSLQRKSTLAAYLAFNEVYGVGYDAYLKYADGILAVSEEDVRKAARKYLDNRKKVVAIVKPKM